MDGDTPHLVPQRDDLLKELAALIRSIAASTDREISEAVAWLHSHSL